MPISRALYSRLSAYYLFHFAALGVLIPFLGPYLDALGYTTTEIGILVGVLLASKLYAPYFWGWLGDRFERRMPIIRLGTFAALFAFLLLPLAQHALHVALVLGLFGFFWNAVLPQFEAVTLNHLGESASRYSHIRLWGSVGYIVAVVGAGAWLQRDAIMQMPLLVTGLLIGIVLAVMLVPESRAHRHATAGNDSTPFQWNRSLLALFLVFFLVQVSHGPYYSVFSLYLGELGYDSFEIGMLWAVGVVAEIAVFLFMPRLLVRYSMRALLLFALAATSLRWLMIALIADRMPVLLLAQTLHLASFGIFHAVAMHIVHRTFAQSQQGRGQALYSSLGFGAGGAVGSFAAGVIWTAWSPAAVFVAAAGVSMLAWALAYRVVHDRNFHP